MPTFTSLKDRREIINLAQDLVRYPNSYPINVKAWFRNLRARKTQLPQELRVLYCEMDYVSKIEGINL